MKKKYYQYMKKQNLLKKKELKKEDINSSFFKFYIVKDYATITGAVTAKSNGKL